ncbi:molecular chaperone DnaK [bacterium]|mgnify:CR=1 FL=1|nr:molecular chaperone DnaK [bacterium]|tara:strand:+ start:4913 stop:6907 length:1995 start_codon:yes stop_codon:yes gene_type:complete
MKILGIDLGTTNSAMAIVEGGEPKIIESAEGGRTTPSIVARAKNDERLVGGLAKRQAVTNPENTLFGIKRLIGHKFEDSVIQKEKDLVPFTIEKADNGGVRVKMGEKFHSPEEISAMILQKMKHDAEAKIGEKITEAVITVPAYFDDAQRKATRDAGEIAGFTVKRIINEPTAAALAYGFNKKKDEQIVVFDFGGGTFDVTVLEVGEEIVDVKATDGDSHMGGEDIDREIIKWIGEEFKKENGIDITKDPLAFQRLKEAAEKAKHELSEVTETEINIPFITSDATGPKHLAMKVTRAMVEKLAMSFVERSIDITQKAVDASGFKISDIDEIVLVGGQTRMPLVINKVRELFGKEPNKSINPDEVVADGAAIQAGILQGDVKDVLLLDVTPLSLGIETMGNVATKLIERNTTIPLAKTQTFSTAADNQTSVEIHVVQGDRSMAADNKTLGRFILDGIAPAPRGLPQVEVSFDIDANGILNVKAKDRSTGKEQSIRIEASSGLSEEDIEKMKKDAELHSEEDKKKKESAEIKNQAETLIHTAEKALKDNADKIPDDTKKAVEEKIAVLKKVLEGTDIVVIKTETEALSSEMQKIGEVLAKQQQASQEDGKRGQGDANSQNDENIKDAEFKEEDKPKDDDNNSNPENSSADGAGDDDNSENRTDKNL